MNWIELSIQVFSSDGQYELIVSPRMNTFESRNQFNSIGIGENLVKNYYLEYSPVLAGRDSLTWRG